MKTKFVLCLIGFFTLFMANASDGMLNFMGDVKLSGNDIPFETNTNGDDHRSITPDIPIFVSLFESNLIEVEFITPVGDVEITILKDGVPVYQSSENITTFTLKKIQLTSALRGVCKIEIRGSNGAYAYGSFEL